MEEIIKRNEKDKITCKIHNLTCTNICLIKNCKMILNCKKCEKIHGKKHNKKLNISLINLLKNKEENNFMEKKYNRSKT